MLPLAVTQKLESLEAKPGVYLFRASDGSLLYVGKASSLRSRVRSYFNESSSDGRYFVPLLQDSLADIETIVTATEKEAALLESELIKSHRPRYNVHLRDDKDYLSLRLDPRQAFPRLEVVRRPRADGARYFGPYPSASAARQTLRLVNRHFQLRTCTDSEMRGRSRPCLQYQIRRCPGPCVLPVDPPEYARQVELVALFLDGRQAELTRAIEQRMRAASGAMDYERAAVMRDQLHAIDSVQETQRVARVASVDQDALGCYREATRVEITILRARAGRVVGVRTYGIADVQVPDAEAMAAFATEYYAQGAFVPDEILLAVEIEAMSGFAQVLTERASHRIRVACPKRGPRRKLVEMANENAAHAFREKAHARQAVDQRLETLREILRLPCVPRRIECLDISHLGGSDTVGAIAALRDGAVDRRSYRTFHVRNAKRGDDFAAMFEVLSRRFARARAGQPGWEAPDLLLVDGGKGQLGVAVAVLRDLGLEALPVAAIAKEKEASESGRVYDRVFIQGQKNPFVLRESHAALRLLAAARDEAHRFSNAFRVETRSRRERTGPLDEVPGVGPRTRARLLRHFGSSARVLTASEEELRAAGANRAQAEAIAARGASGATGTPPPHEASDTAESAAVERAFESAPALEDEGSARD